MFLFYSPESFLVDGLNQLAMRRCSPASLDGSLFHPDDDSVLGLEQQPQNHPQQQSNIVPSSTSSSFGGVSSFDVGSGGGKGGDGGGGSAIEDPNDGVFTSASSYDGMAKAQLEQPTFFSTPYPK